MLDHTQLKEFGKAEADSDSALRVDSRHVKSLQRRAVARNALGKHRAALADLQTAAEIDPSSKQVHSARFYGHSSLGIKHVKKSLCFVSARKEIRAGTGATQ